MSYTGNLTSEAPGLPEPAGWIMFDPTGYPYAWCGSNFAQDAASALAFLVPDTAERQDMCAAGWSISPRRVDDFVRGGRHLTRVSA